MKINMMKVPFIGQTGTGWELDFVILFGLVSLLFGGPGKFSLDKRWFSK